MPDFDGVLATIASQPDIPLGKDFATLTLERNGHVLVTAQDYSRKCGPPGADTIAYRVLAECKDSALDANGFLIDHNRIADYFDATYSTCDVFPSCELIAARSTRDLYRLISGHGAKVVSLTVTIAAFGMAGVTARYSGHEDEGEPTPPNVGSLFTQE